jgi:two-component system chemotaxis response regulator CheY
MPLKDKSVLVVDDMKMVRARLKIILQELGTGSVLEAADGKQALESLKAGGIDLVLSDWNMPNMTGIELLQAMRAQPGMDKIPVIFITSEAQKSNMVQSMLAGVTDYVVKPFSDDQVKKKILSALKIKA